MTMMKMRVLVACGILMMLVGCATGQRFYSSEPRLRKDVAVFVTGEACWVQSVTMEGQPKMFLWDLGPGIFRIRELLPATYELELRYYSEGYKYSNKYSMRGGTAPYTLQATAGHVYYIYPEFPTPDTWRPAVLDIVSDEDYQKLANAKFDPEAFRKYINRYFAGPRIPLKKIDGSGVTIEGVHGKETPSSFWE